MHVNTLEIDFGSITVLEDVTRHITLSNESLIPAEFFCDMVGILSLGDVGFTSVVLDACLLSFLGSCFKALGLLLLKTIICSVYFCRFVQIRSSLLSLKKGFLLPRDLLY